MTCCIYAKSSLPADLIPLIVVFLVCFSASSSSLIQEHVSDMSHSLCSVVPVLSRVLLPRVDPFFLASFIGASLLLLTDLLIQIEYVLHS